MISSTSSRISESEEKILAPDLTPMLDLIFMLLIFFMLTANPVKQILTIDLPEKGSEQVASTEQHETITVILYPEPNHWGVNNNEYYDWESVKLAITEAQVKSAEARFQIAGDRQSKLESLLQLLTYFKSQDIVVADILMKTNAQKLTKGNR